MSNYGPIETFPDGCLTFPNPGASGDFETHPIGTAQRIKELEAEVMLLRRKQRKGITPMRSAREAADDVSTPLMDN